MNGSKGEFVCGVSAGQNQQEGLNRIKIKIQSMRGEWEVVI